MLKLTFFLILLCDLIMSSSLLVPWTVHASVLTLVMSSLDETQLSSSVAIYMYYIPIEMHNLSLLLLVSSLNMMTSQC